MKNEIQTDYRKFKDHLERLVLKRLKNKIKTGHRKLNSKKTRSEERNPSLTLWLWNLATLKSEALSVARRGKLVPNRRVLSAAQK